VGFRLPARPELSGLPGPYYLSGSFEATQVIASLGAYVLCSSAIPADGGHIGTPVNATRPERRMGPRHEAPVDA
jgi:hypothetical protein